MWWAPGRPYWFMSWVERLLKYTEFTCLHIVSWGYAHRNEEIMKTGKIYIDLEVTITLLIFNAETGCVLI